MTDRIEKETGTSPLPLLDNGSAATVVTESPRKSRRWRFVAPLLLIFAGGVGGLYFQGPGLRAFFGLTGLEPGAGARAPIAEPIVRTPSAERVEATATGDVVALGRLRPQDDIVTVATPVGSGDARIAQLLVAEGDYVAEGELLAVLDSAVNYEAALANAQRTLHTRQAVLSQTMAQVSAAEAETRAQLSSAKAASATADASLERARSLYAFGITSQESLEDAQAVAAAARGDVARLTATLSRYEEDASAAQVDIAVAQADVAAAEAKLAQATRDLDMARVYAPRAGTILDIAVREGEKAPPDGLLRLGNTERMEAELEVFQSLVPRVHIGQQVSLVSDVLGDAPLTGTVTQVGTLVGRQTVTADDPTANTDARVVEVVVQLDGESSARAARYVGLEVVARITMPTTGAMLVQAQ